MALREWTEEEIVREYGVEERVARHLTKTVHQGSLKQNEVMVDFLLKKAGHSVVKKIGGQKRKDKGYKWID